MSRKTYVEWVCICGYTYIVRKDGYYKTHRCKNCIQINKEWEWWVGNIKSHGHTTTLHRSEWWAIRQHPCYICGAPGPSGIDRVDSLGEYDLGNCAPCCRDCNRKKNNLTASMAEAIALAMYNFDQDNYIANVIPVQVISRS